MVVVLKLGGSVLTEKAEPETVDRVSLEAVARAIGAADEALLLVHGGGSFGHYHAEQHGVSDRDGTHDPAAVSAIHGAMRRLNDRVVDSLRDHGVPAVGVDPLSMAQRDDGGKLTLWDQPLAVVVESAVVPVLFGDVIADAARGFTVLSGDELTVRLAASLDADRVGMCTTEPGVRNESGSVVQRIESFSTVESAFESGDGWDVTGGMAGKVRALLELPMPSSVFGLDDLPRFLAGEAVGTVIDPAA